jgi:hypothetical protein
MAPEAFLNTRQPSDWFNSLLAILEETPPASNAIQIFTDECRLLYSDNLSALRVIDKFQATYVPTEAAQWYTRCDYLYNLLNQALRQQDQTCLLALHFFIYDLNQQLLAEQKIGKELHRFPNHVHRGQLMLMDEIRSLEKQSAVPTFNYSFLSTTTDRQVAEMFSGAGNYSQQSPVQSIIFDIDCESLEKSQLGVANIQHLSVIGDEEEILFSPMHLFHLRDLEFDEEQRVWIAQFHVTNDTYDVRMDIDQRLIKLDVILHILLNVKTDSAEKKEDKVIDCSAFVKDVALLKKELQLPNLSCVTLWQSPCTVNERLYELKALQSFDVNTSLRHEPKITAMMVATLYDCMATTFKTNGEFQRALDYYERAAIYVHANTQVAYTRKASVKN